MLVQVHCGYDKCSYNKDCKCTRRTISLSINRDCGSFQIFKREEKKEKGENEQSKKRS